MKKTVKRGISILMALGLLLGFAACGKNSDPNVGTWKAVSASMLGVTVSIEEIFENGVTLVLKDGGSCDLDLDGEKVSGTWSVASGALTIEADGISISGSITSDGVLTLENLLDMGLDLTFEREGGYNAGAASGSGTGEEADAELLDWWNGDWYGYWTISDTTAGYAGREDSTQDVHANIALDSSGKGMLYLWNSYEDVAAAEIQVTKDGGSGAMGAATSEGGDLMGISLSHATWIIDPSLYDYDDYMVIDGYIEDEDGEGFAYWVYLRPWGVTWDELPEDERPYNYEYWYLYEINSDMQEAIRDVNGYVPATVDKNPSSSGSSAPDSTASSEENPGEYVWSDRLAISWDTNLFYLDDWGLQDLVAQDESVTITLVPFSNTDSYISAMEEISAREDAVDYKLSWLAFGDYEVTLATFEDYGTYRAHAYINFGNEGQDGQRYYGLMAKCATTVDAASAWNAEIENVLATVRLLP